MSSAHFTSKKFKKQAEIKEIISRLTNSDYQQNDANNISSLIIFSNLFRCHLPFVKSLFVVDKTKAKWRKEIKIFKSFTKKIWNF